MRTFNYLLSTEDNGMHRQVKPSHQMRYECTLDRQTRQQVKLEEWIHKS